MTTRTESDQPIRIGIAGFGFIGSSLARWVEANDSFELAFVYNRDRTKLSALSSDISLTDLNQFAHYSPDIIIEAAHPDITREYGQAFLSVCDYIPLSVTVFADEGLLEQLSGIAESKGHRLLIPHGALVGLDSLFEWRKEWADVCITFRKHPNNIDFTDVAETAESISGPTVLYDGPARGIARRYPRNVNTMVSCALATIGLDQVRAVLIADPGLDKAIAEVEARGKDGSLLITRREQPATGVSGTEMFESLARSLVHATGAYKAIDFL